MRTESKPCFSQNFALSTILWNGSLAARKILHPNLGRCFASFFPRRYCSIILTTTFSIFIL